MSYVAKINIKVQDKVKVFSTFNERDLLKHAEEEVNGFFEDGTRRLVAITQTSCELRTTIAIAYRQMSKHDHKQWYKFRIISWREEGSEKQDSFEKEAGKLPRGSIVAQAQSSFADARCPDPCIILVIAYLVAYEETSVHMDG